MPEDLVVPHIATGHHRADSWYQPGWAVEAVVLGPLHEVGDCSFPPSKACPSTKFDGLTGLRKDAGRHVRVNWHIDSDAQ